jgi:hypothetical protein
MNKQEALQKLASLEAETKALRSIIEAPDKPALSTRWKPRDGETYYQVAFDGWTYGYARERMKDREYAHGNSFQTEAHAEIAAKAVSVTLKVCAAAFAVDPDAGEYIAGARRYSMYRKNDGSFGASGFAEKTGMPVYVRTFEQAVQMADMLNAEGV